ncbi:MAG: alkaline phosphatase family protein, partial [Planctomycetales bacterium]|nr:alkaline phosphatase family protein [Planctomycetales bacterium]
KICVKTVEYGMGVNGVGWSKLQKIEMWKAWNECIKAPQIWDTLRERDASATSAVWFPLHSKGCGAVYICTPAPIHNPDGSESLWCYTRPEMLYGELRDALGHFPLQHFWGPMANVKSSQWIAQSAVIAAQQQRPNFFYIYLPHLDYAAQKSGPDSADAEQAVSDLDAVLGQLFDGMSAAYDGADLQWIIASEYAIGAVDRVVYPNRVLREAGLLRVSPEDVDATNAGHTGQGSGEVLDLAGSDAWALVDHQFAHVFVRDADARIIARVAQLFAGLESVAEVLVGDELARYGLDHPRSGEVVLVAEPDSWFAYYYWLDDAQAPSFARTVDIHRKPGYDPVELHVDMATRSIPLDATLVRGSHGAPVTTAAQQGVVLTSHSGTLDNKTIRDVDVHDVVLRRLGVGR